MKAIQTKYLCPTNTKGSRIKAWIDGFSVTVDQACHEDVEQASRTAVLQFLKKIEWKGSWCGGQLPNGDYAFICINWDSPIQVGV